MIKSKKKSLLPGWAAAVTTGQITVDVSHGVLRLRFPPFCHFLDRSHMRHKSFTFIFLLNFDINNLSQGEIGFNTMPIVKAKNVKKIDLRFIIICGNIVFNQ